MGNSTMIYDFKIHAVDRERSAMGQVEGDTIIQATVAAWDAYVKANPDTDIVHITIEDTVVMPERRKQWDKEQ